MKKLKSSESMTKMAVNSEFIPALKETLKKVNELVVFLRDAEPRIKSMRADQKNFSEDIERLQDGADYKVTTSVNALDTKRGQLSLCERRIAQVSNSIEPKTSELNALLNSAGEDFRKSVEPELEKLIADEAEKLATVFTDKEQRESVAQDSPKVLDFRNYFYVPVQYSPALSTLMENAERFLPKLEAVANGLNPWTFDPASE